MVDPDITPRETHWRHGATIIIGKSGRRSRRILEIRIIYCLPISVSVPAGVGKQGNGIIASCNIVKPPRGSIDVQAA